MITAIGICTVDHLMVVDAFPASEGSFKAAAYRIDGGGMSATALCAASRLGSHTRLVSRVSNDVNGRLILEGLRSHGVDCGRVGVVDGVNSGTCLVLVHRQTGEKQFYSENQYAVFRDPGPLEPRWIDGTSVLMVDGHLNGWAVAGARWAKDHHVPVVADFKRRYDGLDQLWPYIDYPIIPEFFARTLTGARAFRDMLLLLQRMTGGFPVITRGSKGGVYLVKGEVRSYPAFPVDVVDSTGAGDAFHGAFCHFLADGRPFEECLTLASAVGALNCRALGGRQALPTREELDAFLARQSMR